MIGTHVRIPRRPLWARWRKLRTFYLRPLALAYRCRNCIEGLKWHLLGLLVAVLAFALLSSVGPIFIRGILDSLLASVKTLQFTGDNLKWLAFLGGAMVVRLFLENLIYVWRVRISERAKSSIRRRVVEGLMALDYQEAERFKSGDLVTRLTSDASSVSEYFCTKSINIVTNAFMGACVLTFLFIIWPFAFFVCVAMLIPSLAWFLVFSVVIRSRSEKERDALGQMASRFSNAFHGLLDIFGAGAQQVMAEHANRSIAYMARRAVGHRSLYAVSGCVVSLFCAAGRMALWLFGALAVKQGGISLGTLVASVMYAKMALVPMLNLVQAIQSLQSSLPSLERVAELTLVVGREEGGGTCEAPGLPSAREAVLALSGVGYQYPGSDEWALEGVTMDLPLNGLTVIVGANGSGKSTLLKILAGLYKPTSGCIELRAEARRRELSAGVLRGLTVLIPEHVRVFDMGLFENVLLANPAAPDEEAATLLRELNLGRVMDGGPGPEEPMGEAAVRMSAGEAQRIGIARALISNSQIILLDDPLSLQDSDNVKYIPQLLSSVATKKPCVVASHDSALWQMADKLYLIETGRVSELSSADAVTHLSKALAR